MDYLMSIQRTVTHPVNAHRSYHLHKVPGLL